MKQLMKTMLMVGIFMLGISTLVQAQRSTERKPATPEQRAERRTALLKDKLLLTEDQQKEVYTATLKQEQQRNRDRDEMKQNREAFENDLQRILTPEQMKKYEALKEQKKEEAKARMEQRRTEGKMKTQEAQPDPGTDKKE